MRKDNEFGFELLDYSQIKNDKNTFDSQMKSPFRTVEWLEFIRDFRKLTPVIIRITYKGNSVGWFVGTERKILCWKALGSPFKGAYCQHMGFEILDPGIDYAVLIDELLDFLTRQMKYIYITITDLNITKETTERLKHDLYLKNSYDAYFLDMTPTEEVLYKNLASSYRTHIRKFERIGGVIKEDYSMEYINEHNKQTIDVYARHGKVNNILKKIRKIYQHVKPPMLLSIRADIPERENIASLNGVVHGDICFGISFASYRSYLLSRPNQALVWHAISCFKNRGAKIMDLGSLGDYKVQYGAQLRTIPILIYSKYRIVQTAMDTALYMYYKSYKLIGKLLNKH